MIAVILGALAFLLAPRIKVANEAKKSAELILTNLPDRYCPTSAEVVVTKVSLPSKPTFDSTRRVTNCRTIGLEDGWLSSEYVIYVHLRSAAAFKTILSPTRTVSVPVQLGDLNGDNLINGADETMVSLQLGQHDSLTTADIDFDGSVTVLDLALIRLNSATGINRPDNQPWKIAVS